MLHVDVTCEDVRLIADCDESGWQCKLHDGLTGDSAALLLNHRQLGAVLALMIAGDDEFVRELTDSLYVVATPVVKDLPSNLRPIP